MPEPRHCVALDVQVRHCVVLKLALPFITAFGDMRNIQRKSGLRPNAV